MTGADVVEEVAHLTLLEHAHIIRIIGTYVIGREMSILLYPVTEYNLESFLEMVYESDSANEINIADKVQYLNAVWACKRFMQRLANGIAYVHKNFTKHMDLKPQNLLIKYQLRDPTVYKTYIADFGIARSYQDADATNTDGPTSFTFKYASSEVVAQTERGLAVDIFSLGCVYYEIMIAFFSVNAIDHGLSA